ncbi:sensor histidine kinase CheA and response receiver CheY associated with MCPs of class 40H [Geotalea daltonii FRC-32]|uniref:histidine kinase n=1 Tax=Geotalea daltonii (strain DSM 22248 / JCM 15807 / FRC-32) TaxID=316067 RepID=B9LZV7_GEODF|nr:chemotaxis protein CheW [Geotalea daltonii]ACM18921.1 sensor histidine kinase CheA and response receiver CheY associated with MCPs of class 40H [Geotalea daltonii FRC-32]
MPNRNKYLSIFFKEGREHLDSLQKGLLALEKTPDDKVLLRELMRNAHTLKGSAKLVGLEEISAIGHRMEDLFEEIEKGQKRVDDQIIDILLKGADAISRLIKAFSSNEEIPFDVPQFLLAFDQGEIHPQVVEKKLQHEIASEETVRTNVKILDSLINRLGELIINKKRFESSLLRLNELCNTNAKSPLLPGLRQFRNDLEEDVLYLAYLVQELHDDALALRMLPLHTITDGFERMIRDLSREHGKMIEFSVTGAQIEMDRVLLEAVKPMILHILRNCIDHGIETLEERLVEGKKPKGSIEIAARLEEGGVNIVIRDDGRGINPALVRKTAVSKGLLGQEEAAAMEDKAVIELIMEEGFSTRDFITDTSGRGIGMSVVKKNLERLKGNLTIRSEVGRFTEMSLQLPLTLSMMEALLILCSDECFAVPLSYVQETLKIRAEDIVTAAGKEVISLRGSSIPLVSLASLLGLPEPSKFFPEEKLTVVVLGQGSQYLACAVDATLESSGIVVKSLSNQMKNVHFVFGATILGSGDPALILNVPDLFTAAEVGITAGFASRLGRDEEKAVKTRILVVDDSITTRTMERSILMAHGYDVDIAISGEDALEKVAGTTYDLVISDVMMPGITGFELTRRLRAIEKYREVPIIIVSSLATDADKREAMDAGAQAYIVKGSFDQGNLLATVEAFVG